MDVLILGAGVLGKRLAERFKDYELEAILYGQNHCDITNAEQVQAVITKLDPTVVINTAAKTNVDWCEAYPHEALHVNAVGAGVVAAASLGRRLFHISTDFVFQGNTGPAQVSDIPYAIQAYGQSKLMGEQAVRAINPDHMIVRIGWLYGVEYPKSAPMLAYTGSYTQDVSLWDSKRRANIKSNMVHRPAIWDDLKGSPSFVGHVTDTLAWLVATYPNRAHWTGTIHVAPQDEPTSWYDLLKPHFPTIKRGTSQNRAQRPRNGGLVPTSLATIPDYERGIGDWLLECDKQGLRAGEAAG